MVQTKKRKTLSEYGLQLKEKAKSKIYLWFAGKTIPQNI
jgi:hypothetical protein